MLVYSVMYVRLSDVNKGHLLIIWMKSYEISSKCAIVWTHVDQDLHSLN